MRKTIALPFVSFLFLFTVSCWKPCNTVGAYFTVQPLDAESGKVIENLNVSFVKENNTVKDLVSSNFEYVKGSVDDRANYFGVLYVEFGGASATVKVLEWSPIQTLLDNYKIKITDPNGVYKEYTTPILRNLIEESSNKDATLYGKSLTFEFTLEKL